MSHYIKEAIIGKGSFGTVWLVKCAVSQRDFVLKDIDLTRMSEVERQRALTEVTVLSKCRHSNIIGYKDSMINRQTGSLYILMEYADGGDILTAINEQKGVPFPESNIISWFIQICLALQYIHYNNILHRDLKCKNIFLTKNKVIKVGDFGIARVLRHSEDLATTKIGTPYYISPEICRQQPYNCKSDMWALGCILFEMSALEHPFEATDFRDLVMKILKMRRKDFPEWTGQLIRELVNDLLQLEPILRPSADEVLAIPSLQPYLVKFFSPSRIPYLVETVKQLNKERYQKDSVKRSSENSNLEVNKVRFASTGRLHVYSSSPTTNQVNFVKIKSPPETENLPDLTNDKREKTLDSTFLVSSPQNLVPPKIEKLDYGLYKNEAINSVVLRRKQSRSTTELPRAKFEKSLKEKAQINVTNENFSSISTSPCVSKSPCHHSHCHQCMIDMLWKNRIQSCHKTSVNEEEYSELQSKLLSIFKKEKFHKIYQSLLKEWDDVGDLKISSRSYTKALTYEQVQHLPLMIQLVQLDVLKSSLKK